MPALVRSTPPKAIEQQFASGLHFALADMGRSLTAQVISAIAKQLQKKATTDAIGRTLTEMLPRLVESEFARELLKNQEPARERRAMLLHILTAADVQRFGTLLVLPLSEVSSDDEGCELTSEEAAQLLRVSRTHINTLMDAGKLGTASRTAGGHRRVSRTAVLDYKAKSKERQVKGLEAMTDASQRLGLYADEMEGVPRRSKR
jgi:excisionase family DNA binding protein